MHRKLQDGLEYWRRNSPTVLAVAIDSDQAALTYAELGNWSDGIAETLQGAGVRPGDRIGLIGANALAWVASAFGILKAGGVIVPYNPQLTDSDLTYLLGLAELRLIICDGVQASRVEDLAPDLPILVKDDLACVRHGATTGWRPLKGHDDPLAMIIFTSGSTGRPKGVMVSHERQLAKYFELTVAEPSLGAGSRIFMPLAMHAASGTQWGFMFATNIGATCYFTESFAPERALDTLVSERITAFMAISMMYDRIARCAGFVGADLSAIVFAHGGGMRIASETLAAWRDKGVVVRQVYGLTEIGGVGIMASRAEAEAQPDTCGRGMLHTSVRTVRADGEIADPGALGDVLMRSPGMMLGYWRDPEASAVAVRGDWMHTGDIGVLDQDGYFTFIDRAKDMIGSGAERVSPAEVEIVIAKLDSVIEVAVAGVPDSQGDEAIAALIYTSGPLDPARVRGHCRDWLPVHKVPRSIVVASDPLPRMLSGKIDRIALREMLLADASSR